MSPRFSESARRRLANEFIVYRMFDDNGSLLYIGMTSHSGRRFNDHSGKSWFSLVAVITLERHPGAARAAGAERLAILAEKPVFNVRGLEPSRPKSPQRQFKRTFPLDSVAVSDVLNIFNGERHLHWQTIAERLTVAYPARWSGVTAPLISAKMRTLGVPSVSVREPGSCVRYGCRRIDVSAVRAALAEDVAVATH